ncbi:MAG: 1-deoxy-D-xylulose-5-phosphate reductoisomerase [Treponema sp.]|nr:1-deoxy-D-xylulose-5-phosphate reductoisomerase [Treponema sp.]
MKKILVLGATGSIGKSSLEIARHEKDRFSVCGACAFSNRAELESIGNEFSCPTALVKEEGTDSIKRLIETTKPDIVVNGVAGSAGLLPSIFTLEAGIDLALANKESVVMAWQIISGLAKKHGAHILPVDSEHSAIFTLIQTFKKENLDKIILTASGGPFRTLGSDKLSQVTVQDALKHPTWNMGKKITIDSATLGNKGLEVIEACRLFDTNPSDVNVVVHPQSVVHSLIRTKDGIVYAQLSEPDMKHPILQALEWPSITTNFMRPFDLTDEIFLGKDGKRTLTFEKPRTSDFPMLPLAFQAAEKSKSYTIAYNAANEIAVQAFIDGSLSFPGISQVVAKTLAHDWSNEIRDVKDVFEADESARAVARKILL